MNKILLATVCLLLSITSKAQINGTDTVCPANIYTFTATVAGADSFVWSYPTGWFVINGQGNDTVQLYCNQNTGNVCVNGYDAGGNLMGQYCNPVTWGGGGYGWDVAVQPLTPCQCPPSAILIQNNGSGGPCAGCGINGFGSTKTAYAIYDGPWPTGNLMTYAGINSFMSPPTIQTTYYVYYVDTILSQTTPFRITGGLCGGTVNNTFDLYPCVYVTLPLLQSPVPACIGDVVTLAVDPFTVAQLGLSSYIWNSNYGYVSIQGANNLDSVQAIKSSASFNNFNEIEVLASDMNGCGWTGFAEIHVTTCLPDSIIGDSIVCAGYTYNYSASIAGAVSYNWTFPTGWYGISGQGTANVSATCNVNDGNICVEGFDALGNSLGTQCIVTEFGGGGAAGWDVAPSTFSSCINNPMGFIPSINSNGTGGGSCPAGCGSGSLHPNIVYAVYNNAWPNGSFVQYVDGFSIIIPPPYNTTYYVYLVDVTIGLNPNQAILISGGCGSGVVNNTISLFVIFPLPPALYSSPNPACVGDTVTVYDNTGLWSPWWNVTTGGMLLNNNTSSIEVVVTSNPCNIYIEGIDLNSQCFTSTNFSIPLTNCLPSTIVGDTTVCAGYTYNYSATISGAITYQWTFPSGWYGVTGQGTSNVSVTCNVNDGNVCVEGFDVNGNSLGTQCIATEFGGGGATGWDVFPPASQKCNGLPTYFNIIPNGTGGGPGCPAGCGNGSLHPNLQYCVYDDVWPNGIWVGYADGSASYVTPGVYYVYYCDVTNGNNPPQAIRIEGGCGSATINNTSTISTYQPLPANVSQSPVNACPGDTVELTETTGISGIFWGAINNIGLNLLSSVYANPLTAVVVSNNSQIDASGYDANGCLTYGLHDIIYGLCNSGTLTGDSIVCAGYTYNYSATISGAVTYQWTFPSGWYDITGQGTSNVSVTCNVSDGWIGVTGYDAGGNIVGTEQLETHFSAGAGWEVSPSFAQGCYSDHFTVSVNPNGTGGGPGCPSGCGNGVQHPNIVFGIFSDIWGLPGCQYIGQVNVSQIAFMTGTLYIYQVDISNGIGMGQPILIEGGCGIAVVNNQVYVSTIFLGPLFAQSPATVCVGDTVTLICTNGPFSFYQWTAVSNCNVIYQNYDTAIFVVTGLNAVADLQEGCGWGQYNINVSACLIPSVQFASSDTIFCDKQSIDFFDFSTNNPTSWQWTFTGATPNSSTDQNPTGIYYATDGTFDVELIACNANGCDTLLMQNFITEFMAPAIPVITGNSGTMYCSGYSSYQWFLTGSGTVLSTDSFYVPTQQGSYFLIATDTNGCEVASNVFLITNLTDPPAPQRGVLTIVPNPNDGNFEVVLNNDKGIRNFELRILNSIGQVVFESNNNSQHNLPLWGSGGIHHSLLTTHLESGIYFVEVKMDGNIWREKVVINK